jgi:hypothetical protein
MKGISDCLGSRLSVSKKHVWITCRVIQGIHAIVTSTGNQLDRMFVVVIMLPNQEKRQVSPLASPGRPASVARPLPRVVVP